MLEIIERHPEMAVWTVLILAVTACFLGRIFSIHSRAVRQAELDSVLKEEMIQRGMSAQEIVAVLQGGQTPVVHSPEREFRLPPAHFSRPSSPDRRLLWLAVGVPLMMVVLCGGFLFAVASVAVVADPNVPALVEEIPAPNIGR